MQIFFLILVLVFLFIIAIVGALAVMQSRRFRHLNKATNVAVLFYITLSTVLGIAILAIFFSVNFPD